MLQLVDKLVKQHGNISIQLHKKVQSLIVNIINSNKYTLEDKILHIDELLTNYKRPLSASRQDYILSKLTALLEPIVNGNDKFRILDIGGGNGYILNHIGKHFGLQKCDLICLENNNVTNDFKYNFNLKSIEYCFDPKSEVLINEFDLVICMVSLHHMNNIYINDSILPLIKKGKYVLIKEHDTNNDDEIKDRIDWEHHIYHILDTSTFLTREKIQDYLDNYVGNYKSRAEFENIFEANGFRLVSTYNNLLDPVDNNFENKTVTRLFWQLYINKLNF